MGIQLSDRVETLWEKEKLLVASDFSFSHSVFKRFVLQTHKNQGLYGKGLKLMAFCRVLKSKIFPKEFCLLIIVYYYPGIYTTLLSVSTGKY